MALVRSHVLYAVAIGAIVVEREVMPVRGGWSRAVQRRAHGARPGGAL